MTDVIDDLRAARGPGRPKHSAPAHARRLEALVRAAAEAFETSVDAVHSKAVHSQNVLDARRCLVWIAIGRFGFSPYWVSEHLGRPPAWALRLYDETQSRIARGVVSEDLLTTIEETAKQERPAAPPPAKPKPAPEAVIDPNGVSYSFVDGLYAIRVGDKLLGYAQQLPQVGHDKRRPFAVLGPNRQYLGRAQGIDDARHRLQQMRGR